MGDYDFKRQPKGSLSKIDTSIPVTETDISNLFTTGKDILLLIRTKEGDPKRGGFFFNMSLENDMVTFSTMENDQVIVLPIGDAVRFINHVSGLKFDQKMFELCQNQVNFRSDAESKES
jgi:hypothetical protein